ncbi:MAG: NAD(P)/FAD-dependent oxidoreductase [Desulfovibrio sp.]
MESNTEEIDVIVVGAGPAGISAGIYAARSGLSSVLLEKKAEGGQVAVTPTVENYPGYEQITGTALTHQLAEHARQYVDIRKESVRELKVGKRIEVYTTSKVYLTKAVILSMGVNERHLNVEGEDKFYGRGVHYCATCDGFMYKDRKVLMAGGGDSALTEAIYLHELGASVEIIHRRDTFRAQEHLQQSARSKNIPVHWNSVVEEIIGEDRVTGVRIRNVETDATETLETEGLFIAIGNTANSAIAAEIGIETRKDGSIVVDGSQRTSMPRIYAAGDITGGVRQIVTAAGQGAIAATTAFKDITQWEAEKSAK